jgi:hypothetical protein
LAFFPVFALCLAGMTENNSAIYETLEVGDTIIGAASSTLNHYDSIVQLETDPLMYA